MLSKDTTLPEDKQLPDYVHDIIERRDIVLYLNESLNGPPVEGAPVYSRLDFIESNWRDDPEKQDEIRNSLGEERHLLEEEDKSTMDRSFTWTITEFKENLLTF